MTNTNRLKLSPLRVVDPTLRPVSLRAGSGVGDLPLPRREGRKTRAVNQKVRPEVFILE